LIGKNDCLGIGELIYKTYFSIDMEIKKLLFNKIVLIGGNMLFPNIAERISQNIKSFGGNTISYKLIVPAERKYSVWIGGSILSSLSTFQSLLISKEEYEERGPSIVNIKKF
jgi:actin-related protein